jgi:hypothetical protein
MTDPRHDPAMKAALDRFTVPPPTPGFADRIVAAAMMTAPSEPSSSLPPLPHRAGSRGQWRHPSRIVAGALAMSLISAAAAATGYLGDRVQTIARDLPVVGPMIAQVVPKPKIAPVRPWVKPATVQAAAPPLTTDTPDAVSAPLRPMLPPAVRREIRREIIAERIATGLERRAERRAALGLPDRPSRAREVNPVLRRIPPGDRRAVIQRVREIRRERAGLAVPSAEPARPVIAEDSSLPVPDAQLLPAEPVASPPAELTGEASPQLAPDRAERLRRFREMRQRRLEMLRQQEEQ